MKVYWSIEGVGCEFHQCGNKMRLLEIEEEEVDGMTPKQRQDFIDEAVEEEFKRIVFPVWEEKDSD